MKKKLLLIYALSYLTIVAAFTGYWANHFMEHVHVKGDDLLAVLFPLSRR